MQNRQKRHNRHPPQKLFLTIRPMKHMASAMLGSTLSVGMLHTNTGAPAEGLVGSMLSVHSRTLLEEVC